MNTQQNASDNAQALLNMKATLNIADADWKGRSSEQVLYTGKLAVTEGNLILWQGQAGVTRDGIYYTVRCNKGQRLHSTVDPVLATQTGMWWTDKAHRYFGHVWDSRLVNWLKTQGVNVQLIDESVARADLPTGVTPVKTPAPQSVNAHLNGSHGTNVNTTVSDLPPGVVLNGQGVAMYDKTMGDKAGRFVGKEALSQMRRAAGIVVTPAQQVGVLEMTKKAEPAKVQEPIAPVGGGNGSNWSEYDKGRYVAMLDDAREIGEQPWPDEVSQEWMDGYAEYFAPPVPKVDPELLAMKDSMGALASMMAELMAKLNAKLGS